jgi:mannose-6-phosphate isomerase-like protein (cupin superfamily)
MVDHLAIGSPVIVLPAWFRLCRLRQHKHETACRRGASAARAACDTFASGQPQQLLLMKSINLAEKLSTFAEHWQPRVVGQFNGHDLMVVKVKGEFVWHKHDDTDDFFLVLHGRVRIQLRGEEVLLGPGEVFVVPKGVEHRPVADDEAHILLIEPMGTPNTGNAETAAPRRTAQ